MSYLILGRGEKTDGITEADGEAGRGVYCWIEPNPAMKKYYTSQGERLVYFKVPSSKVFYFKGPEITEFIQWAKNQGVTVRRPTYQRQSWFLRGFVEYMHPECAVYVVDHKGDGVPSSKQAIIIDLSQVEEIEKP